MFRLFDLIGKNADVIGKEWFRIMEWLLIISALQAAAMLSKNTMIKALPFISIAILWSYVYFGYSQKYFNTLIPHSPKTIKEIIIPGIIATAIGYIFFTVANIIGGIAISLVSSASATGK